MRQRRTQVREAELAGYIESAEQSRTAEHF